MKYFYARVSTKGQNLARQTDAAEQVEGIARVFCDKQSGKDFNRPAYNELKSVVVKGDEVVVKSLDRLGRNKDDTKSELAWFKERGVLVRIMDLPTTMIEFPVGQEWVLELVNNILIEVIAAIAEQERKTIKQRQREGIDAMPVVDGKRVSAKTGREMGRPRIECDRALFGELVRMNERGEISVDECCVRLGVSRATWFLMKKRTA